MCGEDLMSYSGTALITLLGFDVTHAVIAFSTFNPQKVVCILASVGGVVDARTEIAFSSFFNVAKLKNVNVDISKLIIEVLDIVAAINNIYTLIKDLISRYQQVIVDIGGGLRLLVIEMVMALLKLRLEERRKVKAIVFIEGRNEYRELPDMTSLIWEETKLVTLSNKAKILLAHMDPQRDYKLSELQEILEKALNQSISRTSIYRIVKELEEAGLVTKIKRGKYKKVM
jgi:DNA-binding transcriptional ArsR family regulator